MLEPTLVLPLVPKMLVLVWRCFFFKRSCTVALDSGQVDGLLRARWRSAAELGWTLTF